MRIHNKILDYSLNYCSTCTQVNGNVNKELLSEIHKCFLSSVKSNDIKLIAKQMIHILEWIQKSIPVWESSTKMKTPNHLLKFQKKNTISCLKLASGLEGEGIKQRCENSVFQDELANMIIGIQNNWQATRIVPNVNIKLAAGGEATLNNIRYCCPKSPSNSKVKKRGRPKKNRGTNGSGSFPSIEQLGIIEGVTPFLASEVALEATDGPSMECAKERLARRNITLTTEQIREISENFGIDGLALRLEWVKSGKMPKEMEFKSGEGSILLIEFDGFKIRLRQEKKGRIPKDKKRHGFFLHWTETKSFLIREIDKKGRKIPGGLSIIDGTLGTADDMFSLLEMYLFSGGLDLGQYDYIVFGSDGAEWIPDREKALAEKLPVPDENIWMFVDWYHATEHLWEIVNARKGWKQKDREAWVKEAKGLLWNGDIDGLVAKIDVLCIGRNARDIDKKKRYFVENVDRMQYAMMQELGLPIGSGAIESAGRQTINLRLKGPGMVWLPVNGEAMVMMRSYLKSGNWDMYTSMVANFRARRFDKDHPAREMTISDIRNGVEVEVPVHPKSKQRKTNIHNYYMRRTAINVKPASTA